MTTHSTDTLLGEQRIDVTTIDDGEAFLARLVATNDGLTNRVGEAWGFAWWPTIGQAEVPVQQVYSVVRELLSIRRRPRGAVWH